MNWIILLLAGLFEVSLTFLFGEDSGRIRFRVLSLGWRFSCLHNIKHDAACQGRTNVAVRHSLCHLDGYRGGRYGPDRYFCL